MPRYKKLLAQHRYCCALNSSLTKAKSEDVWTLMEKFGMDRTNLSRTSVSSGRRAALLTTATSSG